jgi:hypothetical protein
MKKILFFKIDVFEVMGYKSIEVRNLKEIEDCILKGKVHFIIFPEDMDEIEEVVSSFRKFFFESRLTSYPVLIQRAESHFHIHGAFMRIKKIIIPRMIEQWI